MNKPSRSRSPKRQSNSPSQPEPMQRMIMRRVFPSAIAILLLILGLCQFAARRSVEQEVGRRLDQAASFSAGRLEKQLDLLRDYTASLASNDLTINSIIDRQVREEELTLFLRSLRLPSPAFRRATMADYKGRPVIANQKGGDISVNEFLDVVMSGEHYFDVNQERIIAASPVIYGGNAEAVLAVEYDTGVFLQELQSLDAGQRFQVLSCGTQIYDSAESDSAQRDWVTSRQPLSRSSALSAENGGDENTTDPQHQSSPRLHSSQSNWRSANYDGLVAVRSESRQSAFEPLWFVNAFFAGVFLLSVFAILIGTIASTKLSIQPLRTLIDDIAGIEASGSLDRRVRESGPSEFVRLAQSFNRSLDSLSKTTVSLGTLTESENRLRTVIETVPHGILASNSNNEISLVNRQLERLSGYSRSELIGLPVSTLVPEWDTGIPAPPQLLAHQDGKATESPRQIESSGLSRTGQAIPLEIRISSVRTSGGTESLASVVDVSARKERERENELLWHQTQLILDSIPALVIFKDLKNRIVRVNQAVASLVGSTPEEIQGRHSSEFFEEHEKYYQDDLDVVESGGPRLGIVESITTEDGSMRWVSTDKIPVRGPDGEIDGIIAVINDITDLKAAENSLRETNERLLRSNEDLGRFAYVASHDLQEPLRKITSFCALLQEDYSDALDQDGRQFIHYIVDGASRMRTLIQDLLTFSRIEESASSQTSIDLNQCLQAASVALEEAISESDAVITNDTLPFVTGHQTQMVQLLQNLIGNSIKYRSDDPPRVHIAGPCSKTGSTFSVQDNGIGVDAAYHDQIFGVFKRLHGADRYPGTGIGLAICKRIVEHQGGRIWVESAPGRGTTVFVSL